ncbi:hypothetical protein AbraIFM66951_002267 [Aspergillus brasiliensis]|uniref:Uncharacterized protein n=1 Tax=Aspergillus brasiliensis TaxID=319629 RepID=A0A9W6DQR7_9EURO|nr:hypothetical protein AbraCBS73388_011079 [Aspergillus brasiliensis]GKZ42576.1 hypothetical protein AbraIFM66951_002267 [Aspergillus brasiliensis]
MKGEFIVSSRSYIDRESSVGRAALATVEVAPVIDHSLTHFTALDALEAAFARLLAQEAAAERGQARWHRDIRGPSAGEEAVAGIASAVRSEFDRMTAHNTAITYLRVGLLGVSLGRITTLRRRIALGRVPVRRPSQNDAQIRGIVGRETLRPLANAGNTSASRKLDDKPASKRDPEPTRRGRLNSEYPVQDEKPPEIGRNGGGRKTYAWGGGGGPL